MERSRDVEEGGNWEATEIHRFGGSCPGWQANKQTAEKDDDEEDFEEDEDYEDCEDDGDEENSAKKQTSKRQNK